LSAGVRWFRRKTDRTHGTLWLMCETPHHILGRLCLLLVFEAFEVGREYSYQDINIEIGYSRDSSIQRGILLVPIGDRSAIMIRMNLRSNLYGEEYDPSAETLFYIGDGLPEQGHQQRVHGNKRLTDNIDKDVHLFVSTRAQRSGKWTYGGIWRVESHDPAYPSRQFTPNGEPQKVFRYKLVRKDHAQKKSVSPRTQVESTLKLESLNHTSTQWSLLFIGRNSGFDTWVPSLDKGKEYHGHHLRDQTLDDLPDLGLGQSAKRIVENIDVLWFSRNRIVAAFEVEHTTSIHSGISRLGDLALSAPNLNIDLFLVASDERKGKLERELSRPLFGGLRERIRFITYSALLDRLRAAQSIIELGGTLKSDFLTSRAERV